MRAWSCAGFIAAGACLGLLAGCTEAPPPEAAGTEAAFIQKVAQQDLFEIQIGQLAVQNAVLIDIQAYGQAMAEKHQQSLNKLAQLAVARHVSLPTTLTDDQDEIYLQISHERDIEFQRHYIEAAFKAHRDELDTLQAEASGGSDSELVAFARDVSPVVVAEVQEGARVKDKEKSRLTPAPFVAKLN
jgi:putative membrane protein